MSNKVEPREGQRWTHRQLGGEFDVTDVAGGSVRLQRVDGRASLKMRVEQLWEHYVCVVS